MLPACGFFLCAALILVKLNNGPYYNSVFISIFDPIILVWDVMGEVMGVVWGVANFATLLFFSWGKPC